MTWKYEDIKEFLSLNKDFIEWEKAHSKDVIYAEKSDLFYLCRFISGSTNAWEIVNKKKGGFGTC